MSLDCASVPQSNDDEMLIGAFMPRQFIDLLDLHALLEGVSRSNLIRKILNEWVISYWKEKKTVSPTLRLIEDIALQQSKEIIDHLSLLPHEAWNDTKVYLLSCLHDKLIKHTSREQVESIVERTDCLAKNYINSIEKTGGK